MIVDTSVLVAILKREPGWELFATALDRSEHSSIPAATYVELSVVIDRWENSILSNRMDDVMQQFRVAIEPFTPDQARIARQACRDYGRGSGHPANLNLGDCFSYALARDKREPILFKGADFLHTDLQSAV